MVVWMATDCVGGDRSDNTKTSSRKVAAQVDPPPPNLLPPSVPIRSRNVKERLPNSINVPPAKDPPVEGEAAPADSEATPATSAEKLLPKVIPAGKGPTNNLTPEHNFGILIIPATSKQLAAKGPCVEAGTINGKGYEEVYRSIPFSRTEYLANPSYRHDATMEILFGQLRPTTIHRHDTPVRVDNMPQPYGPPPFAGTTRIGSPMVPPGPTLIGTSRTPFFHPPMTFGPPRSLYYEPPLLRYLGGGM